MSDGEEDPFEDIGDDVEDREGDPFESLETEQGAADSDTADRSDERTETDEEFVVETDPSLSPTGGPDDEAGRFDSPRERADDRHDEVAAGPGEGPTAPSPDADDAGDDEFADEGLPPDLTDVDTREGDPFESLGAFEDRSVEEVDPDVVWQTLGRTETVTDDSERTSADVSKHRYCEQCEYFSPPPDVSCTHEGTEIVEFRDMETVRLVDCPVVAERRRLERRD